jgi:putative protein-disulfide isomerase
MKLYYVHDPMCSWCWTFRPVWQKLQHQLPSEVSVSYVLGGLAPDSHDPMTLAMQRQIQHHWHVIQKRVPGTMFNFDFWKSCEPRRSTFAACRAVIAAKAQADKYEDAMILAIQEAYYLHAQNPSDDSVLIACAEQIGLDVQRFTTMLNSEDCKRQLRDDVCFSQEIGAEGFPSLILYHHNQYQNIRLDYEYTEPMLKQLFTGRFL